MTSRPGDPEPDPLLRPYLDAETMDGQAAALERLLGVDTEHVLRDAVRRALGSPPRFAAEAEDVASEVRVRLVQKLGNLRRGAAEPIGNFHGYVVRAAQHAAYALMRRRFPERTRLKNRVRYVAGHHPGVRLRVDANGEWICETARPLRAAPEPGATRAFGDDPAAFAARHGLDRHGPLPTLVEAIVSRLDAPIGLDALADAMATLQGIVDRRPAAGEVVVEQLADRAAALDDTLAHRQSLERTWREVVELPPRQRAALLLNLRDSESGAVLTLLPATGVVTMGELARALELTPAALDGLWPRLPLDDLAIAERMGVTRQQVINLRKSARARLARRLARKPS
jgi:DNA-directed RNA polymerase specialized sigma24 family protein